MVLSIIGTVLGFVGALSLLLYGMDMLSNGIQKGAGNSMQKLMAKISGNRFSAVLTGLSVTAIIQSSGATTVMVVSFVNAEIISLTQAIGIIFGANIGTTVTAWIVSFFGFSFSISAMAIPLFGIGFILKYFKRFKIHNFAGCFMGFALLFMGLDLLKNTLNLSPSSVAFLQNFSNWGVWGLLLGVLIGAVITALIHSSSAMTAIVLTMAANGSLPWELSAAIVLGSNIGSTIDAVMSSFGASINAKRTAAVHVGFNVIGTVLALLVFKPFLNLIDIIVPGAPAEDITTHIAMLHTIFNVVATLLFIPFVNQIANLVTKLIKDKAPAEDDLHYKLPVILPKTHASTDLYIFQVNKEVARMAEKVMEMFDEICNTFINHKNADVETSQERVNFLENYVDEMNDSITTFLQRCTRLPSTNKQDRNILSRLIQTTDALENLSDECCSMMHTLTKYISNKKIKRSDEQTKELSDYLETVRIFYEHVCQFLSLGISPEDKLVSNKMEDQIDATKRELKKSSKKRMEADNSDIKVELQYMDIVRKIEKAGDCVYTIVQAM